jgi:cation transporter-like permease
LTPIRAVLPTAIVSTPTRTPVSQVIPAVKPVVRELPRAGSGPDDGSFPWATVLGGFFAATGLVLLFSGLHRRLSDTER